MNTEIKKASKYLEEFKVGSLGQQSIEKAFDYALDIRKFEIELYWKRAAYFWTLIAASFAGYFALQSADPKNPVLIFLVSCIGLILSLGWYLVNRGSKYWQENWERHVDVLESEVIGPLYKTTKSQQEYCFFKFWSGYPYSVSKVNQLISIFITFIWFGIAFYSFPQSKNLIDLSDLKYWLIAGTTIVFIVLIFVLCQTGSDDKPRKVHFVKSELEDTE